MRTIPEIDLESRHRPHPSMLVGLATLAAVIVLLVLGVLVIDPAQRASVVLVSLMGVALAPFGALIQTPAHRAPWVAIDIVVFVALAELALRGAQPVVGDPSVRPLETNAIAGGAFLVLLVSEVWMLASRPRFEGEVRDRRSGLVISVCLAGAFGGAMFVADVGVGPEITANRWPLVVLGVGLSLGALLLRLWAVASLGRFFQPRLVVQPDHRVVSNGPYRLIRHPSYAGPMLIFLGIGLILGSWVALALCVILPCGAYAYRIHVEEQLLVEGLGSSYEEYRRSTWKILPGMW